MLRHDLVESVFHASLLLPEGAERTAWIEAQCQVDSELVLEVNSLLEAHSRMKAAGGTRPQPAPGIPTASFGSYRATELLGQGGMSSVYLARRADGQFEQTVALKIMAGYLTGPEFLRRFEIERQLLATLNHNNITRLLDGGVSSSGDPFLITEYVDRPPIDRWCDDRKLDVRARLKIFIQVCDAVDYAHRNLVVHRDLKPANILVNAEGLVKLLDFGTASLVAADAATSNATMTHSRMLTPRYASPEQLRGERLNIATDVFSLGVVLYELLSGAWPFGDPTSVLCELNRATGTVQADPPSTVITEESAERRAAPSKQLRRILKGDLSAIVLKALEQDAGRRYESVRQFAADISSFLEGRPVQARRQTAFYRAGKSFAANGYRCGGCCVHPWIVRGYIGRSSSSQDRPGALLRSALPHYHIVVRIEGRHQRRSGLNARAKDSGHTRRRQSRFIGPAVRARSKATVGSGRRLSAARRVARQPVCAKPGRCRGRFSKPRQGPIACRATTDS